MIGSPRLEDCQATVAFAVVEHVQMDPGVGQIRYLGKCLVMDGQTGANEGNACAFYPPGQTRRDRLSARRAFPV